MRAVEKRLRLRIKDLESEVEKLKNDRQKFRDHFERRFKWWLSLLGEGKHPVMSWLVEDEAKFMAGVERWYW